MDAVKKIIDVSGWHQSAMSVGGGTRDKLVFRRTKFGKVYYMVKGHQKDVGELRAEVCASNLGRIIGFPVQQARFCIIPDYEALGFSDQRGVLIRLDITRQKDPRRNIFKEDLLHGMDIIALYDPAFQALPDERTRRSEYKLSKVVYSLRNFIRQNPSAKTLWYSFYELMVFDALIGGTDRHYRNWGVLVDSETRKYTRFAPAFDNGISLLWNTVHHKTFINSAIDGHFVKKAKSAFRKDGGGQYSLFELCEELAKYPEITSEIIDVVKEKVCLITDSKLKKALITYVPHSSEFETEKEILAYLFEYVKMRLQILKELLNRL
ncbi:MAG: HipA domain-containing protein [Patescibacteria group bacterium]